VAEGLVATPDSQQGYGPAPPSGAGSPAPSPRTPGPGGADVTGPDPRPGGPRTGPRRPPGGREETTHFSVVDDRGNAVAATQTLGEPFGSGASASRLGFFLGASGPPSAEPRAADSVATVSDGPWPVATLPPSPRPAGEGEWTPLPGSQVEVVLPLAPTLVTSRGKVELALGSPAGERGLAAIVQVLVRVLDLQEPLGRAVLGRRLHLSAAEGEEVQRVYLEGIVWSDTLSAGEAERLWGRGVRHRVAERGFRMGERDLGPVVQGMDPWFGGVNAVARSGGDWTAAGDERRDGAGGVLQDGSISVQGEPGGVSAGDPAPPPAAPPAAPDESIPPDPGGPP